MRQPYMGSFKLALAAALLAALVVLAALQTACAQQTISSTAPASAQPSAAPQSAAPQPAAQQTGAVPAIGAGPQTGGPRTAATAAPQTAVQKLLQVNPDHGKTGEAFVITGAGLPPNKSVEFVWATVDGNYVTQVSPENVEFHDKQYADKKITLGKATTDAQGHITASFQAPEDYGGVHDIFADIDGADTARGGFNIVRNVTISPTQGPLGTPITIKVTGLGSKPYESTIAVRYDNHPTGIITAVTTQGSASAQIRAAGKAGKHVIDIDLAARSVPFLNNQQSGTAYIPDQQFTFNITDDSVVPSAQLDWPDPARVTPLSAAVPKTGGMPKPAIASNASTLTPTEGPILSQATTRLAGLTPNAGVELFWVSARGNRVSPSGWSLTDTSLGQFTTGADGSLNTAITVPDDLGGWHEVKAVQDGKVVAQLPYLVERSLVGVTPLQVHAGDTFTVHLKGVGWTELDNGVAVTYDNAYIGFACGFNSNGDITLNLTATGGPGVHLIDLYPMLYQGHGAPPWGYQEPFLSFASDFPGLALGYNLPAFRLAVEVVGN